MSNLVWRIAAVGLAVIGLGIFWGWGPLATFADPDVLAELGGVLRGQWYSVPAAIVFIAAAGLFMAPQSVLIVASGLIFGPVLGFIVAVVGSMAGAAVVYAVGSATIGRMWRDRAGSRLHDLSIALANKGLLSMTVIRMVPFAHFSAVSLAAGASHIRFWDFFLGTALGAVPWMAATIVVTTQFAKAMTDPTTGNIAVFVGIAAVYVVAVIWAARRFGPRFRSGGAGIGADSGPNG